MNAIASPAFLLVVMALLRWLFDTATISPPPPFSPLYRFSYLRLLSFYHSPSPPLPLPLSHAYLPLNVLFLYLSNYLPLSLHCLFIHTLYCCTATFTGSFIDSDLSILPYRLVKEMAVAVFCLKLVRYCLYMWLPLYLEKAVGTAHSSIAYHMALYVT